MNNLDISNLSLFIVSLLVVIAILIDAREKLGLGKEIFIAAIRVVIQLFIVGFILRGVFQLENGWVTLIIVIFMVVNAAYNAHTRSQIIDDAFKISLISIGFGTGIALIILVLSHAISWTAQEVIPITGMIAAVSMTTVGLVFGNLHSKFKDQRQQVQERLSLGANRYQASHSVIRESIKLAMQPTIDNAKTVGLVSLPGMMTGLILAGLDPLVAIKYQIMIMFMMLGVTSITAILASYLAYQKFFNEYHQLVL